MSDKIQITLSTEANTSGAEQTTKALNDSFKARAENIKAAKLEKQTIEETLQARQELNKADQVAADIRKKAIAQIENRDKIMEGLANGSVSGTGFSSYAVRDKEIREQQAAKQRHNEKLRRRLVHSSKTNAESGFSSYATKDREIQAQVQSDRNKRERRQQQWESFKQNVLKGREFLQNRNWKGLGGSIGRRALSAGKMTAAGMGLFSLGSFVFRDLAMAREANSQSAVAVTSGAGTGYDQLTQRIKLLGKESLLTAKDLSPLAGALRRTGKLSIESLKEIEGIATGAKLQGVDIGLFSQMYGDMKLTGGIGPNNEGLAGSTLGLWKQSGMDGREMENTQALMQLYQSTLDGRGVGVNITQLASAIMSINKSGIFQGARASGLLSRADMGYRKSQDETLTMLTHSSLAGGGLDFYDISAQRDLGLFGTGKDRAELYKKIGLGKVIGSVGSGDVTNFEKLMDRARKTYGVVEGDESEANQQRRKIMYHELGRPLGLSYAEMGTLISNYGNKQLREDAEKQIAEYEKQYGSMKDKDKNKIYSQGTKKDQKKAAEKIKADANLSQNVAQIAVKMAAMSDKFIPFANKVLEVLNKLVPDVDSKKPKKPKLPHNLPPNISVPSYLLDPYIDTGKPKYNEHYLPGLDSYNISGDPDIMRMIEREHGRKVKPNQPAVGPNEVSALRSDIKKMGSQIKSAVLSLKSGTTTVQIVDDQISKITRGGNRLGSDRTAGV